MNRAQEIRRKRLEERKNHDESRLNVAKMHRVGKLFEWVLDLFEKPTRYNTLDEVILTVRRHYVDLHLLYLGKNEEKKISGEVYIGDLKELAKMFNEEEGYQAEYHGENFFNNKERVVIKIK